MNRIQSNRLTYNTLTYNTLQSSQPSYLRQLLVQRVPLPPYITLLRPTDRSKAMAVPSLWNKLPPALRQLSYELAKTSPLSIFPQLFYSKLKTMLFNKSYLDLSSSPYCPPCLNSKHHPP